MLTVDQALSAILARVQTRPAERASLLAARGRVLAEDVHADIDNPPFDNAAVDGYAVRAADTAGAEPERPVVLREVAEVPAGSVAAEMVGPGVCMRVMTGAPMPAGADAMVMVEDTRREAGPLARQTGAVAILAPAQVDDNVRRRGEDVRAGQKVLAAGTRLGPPEIAMLAAMGQPAPLCVRPPRVAILSTGDELVAPDQRPGPGQIRDSNRFALAALVAEAGAELHSIRHLPDAEAATEAAIRECAGLDGSTPADVIVTSGGVSVGDRDFVKPVLERLGVLELWRVKMKPGKPVAFGRVAGPGGETLFFGLPGNPVSTMVTFELFVRPTLWRMAGRGGLARTQVRATLTGEITHMPGRREYVRAAVRPAEDGAWLAEPTGAQGSGILSSMLGANALLIVPEEAGSLRAGDPVEAIMLDFGGLDPAAFPSRSPAPPDEAGA